MPSKLTIPNYTKEQLKALRPDQRHTIWIRARTMTTDEAKQLARDIEELGLPYSDPAALRMDDPVTIKMHEIINSAAGRAACINATEDGLPAIAGVDAMLNEALGVEYRGGNMGTQTAGSLVGELMRSLGYSHGGQRPLPPGCVAKTGAFWVKGKSKQ